MKLKRLLSIFLVSVMLMTVFGPAMPTMAMALESLSSADQNELFQANLAANGEVNTDQTAAPPVYQDGVILLYSFAQLQLVGSDAALTSADSVLPGSGSVLSDNNQTISYAMDQTYRIVNDIAVPEGEIWRLPQGFTGVFVSSETEKPLYDAELDTIYICNPYQLETMAMDDAEEQPVLSQDADASTFGSGKLIYLDDDNENYLTYGSSHHYVISKAFAYKAKPVVKAAKAPSLRSTNDPLEGRDYVGQVSKRIGDTTYILIGNRQQLDALTSDETIRNNVCKPVYKATEKTVEVWRSSAHLSGNWIWLSEFNEDQELKDGNGYGKTANEVLQAKENLLNDAEIIYPGDADLVGQFAEYPLYDVDASRYHQLGRPAGTATSSNSNRTVYFTVNTTTGLRDISTATESNPTEGSLKYYKDGNYIIFRDIDMTVHYRPDQNTTDDWQPLTFTGTMYGAKSVNGEKLWNTTLDEKNNLVSTEITATTEENRPVISNIVINQASPINVGKDIGIGFFATITNRVNTANVGVSGGTAIIKNLELQNVSVSNNTSDAKNDTTVLSAVTSSLGTVLGSVVDLLVTLLSFGSAKLNLSTILSNLLNARASDPTIFATGTFAGRMIGDVLVEDCIVTHSTDGNIQISNINDRTGGFVGFMEGVTEYDGLSKVLGGLTDVLSGVLNVIPGLGLGDLISILLKNGLPLENLIPIGYESPLVKNCGIVGLSGEIGSVEHSYNGGFVGQQIGSHVTESFIKDSNYTVKAKQFGGGFSGIGRDAVIEGLLDGVGVDLSTLIKNIQNIHPQTVLTKDEIVDSVVNVTGGDYLGGFVGDLNNSYSIDCCILKTENAIQSVTVTVNGSGNMIGGYAGCATVGWTSSLGKDENTTNSLLGTVGSLLTGVLSSDPSAQKQLLTIAGVGPSAIIGCQLDTDLITVHAGTNFSGGLLGKGDGVLIKKSDQEAFDELSSLNSGTIPVEPSNNIVKVNGLLSVTADGDYAGGIAGHVGSASVSGLLNGTVGVGDFMGFSIRNVIVTGVDAGYVVQTTGIAEDMLGNNAGGGFGITMGGTIQDVHLYNLKSVSANNRAGGFVGLSGPGELAGTNGLTVNLLGLNHLINLQNLLSIGQGVEVHIEDSTVTGISSGFTAIATGQDNTFDYSAGGFVAKSNSTKITNCHSYNILSVTAAEIQGYAGGFVGTSETGGLADVADENTVDGLIERQDGGLLKVDGLVNAITYLLPKYTNCTANYVSGGYVDADVAGGFVGDLKSGTVDNTTYKRDKVLSPYAVYNIDRVYGRTYGGGFGGRLVSGALAQVGKGVSVLGDVSGLNLDIGSLVSVVNAYIPYINYAGVYAPNGFTVEANTYRATDLLSGSAGGFAGYTSGAQISHSDVMKLKKTTVTPPSNLEAVNAPSYYNESEYSVSGAQYAGGYAGFADVGNAASLGKGLNILGTNLSLSNILSALSVVVTTIEHSKVQGMPGGFSVLATGEKVGLNDTMEAIGSSGGFIGQLSGGHIQNSHSLNFSFIIGEIVAGGYVGKMEPGDAASVLGESSILSGLVDTRGALASLAEDFVPTIRNSTTTCIPCGGAVRANSYSNNTMLRGMAGGYAGYNHGGNIWGMDNHTWKDQNDGVIFEDTGLERQTDNHQVGRYTGEKSICAAYRIYSVYGCEYAGGYTGLMDCGDTASTGSFSLLYGLVKVDNLLGLLSVVYPSEENTAVYGPLSDLDYQTWNSWVEHIGKYGGYGSKIGPVNSQEELDEILDDYVYGFNVVAGRNTYDDGANTNLGGCAGGHIGAMVSGTVTNGQSYDVRTVKGMKSAGGYIGDMRTGGAANLGSASILRLPNIDFGALLNAVQVFVPVIKTSSTEGYQSGLTVIATGSGDEANNVNHKIGSAGGYVGASYGGQIWGDDEDSLNAETGCNVVNLKKVQGVLYTGGFGGLITAASVADVNTNATSGLLQEVLDTVIRKPSNLLSLLQATVPTVRQASVSSADSDWGFTVEGYENTLPLISGGFVGSSEAGVLGSGKGESELTVTGLRGVIGRQYAGGFIGLGDVGSVASVSGNDGTSGQTDILGLIQAGEVSVLDIFRTYIYYADVEGAPEGFSIKATASSTEGILGSTRHTGCAGGFGGGLMNGTITNSSVSMLSSVEGLNYVGGFIGHLGKNGVADVDNANVADVIGLANATAGVLDVFGSHVDNSTITGRERGFTVNASGGVQPVAGGFVGYGDLSKIDMCSVERLKTVTSDGTAGGFIGLTAMNYAGNVEVDSAVVDALVKVVNTIIKALYLDQLEQLNIINIGVGNVLGLSVLTDGDLVKVNLFGLPIAVSLSKANESGGTDVALITIGDSSVSLACDNNGLIDNDQTQSNLTIHLLKANRSTTSNSTVSGISIGYDVLAEQYAGGFIGYNNESEFANNEMIRCDEIKGAANKVGPFSGSTSLESVYSFNTLDSIEGDNNVYHIYRDAEDGLQSAVSTTKGTISSASNETVKDLSYSRFDVTHRDVITDYTDFDGAYATTANGNQDLGVYRSSSDVVLMLKRTGYDNPDTIIPENSEMQYPCKDTIDFTINKIWDDNGHPTGRPNQVTVTLYQSYTLGGQDHTSVYDTYTLTPANAESPFTDAVWTLKIEDLPAQFTQNDNVYYYTYSVEETPVSGYATVIHYSDDHYTANITNIRGEDQAVVVDYGLPMSVNVLEFLKIKAGFSESTLSLNGIGGQTAIPTAPTGFSNQFSGEYGVSRQTSEQVSYTLGDFKMPEKDLTVLSVQSTEDGRTVNIYPTVTFVPASLIYYEDNEVGVTYVGNWTVVTDDPTDGPQQGEDRPDMDEELETIDKNNIYGYDAAYEDSVTYGLGSAHKITVSAADNKNWPYAEFTFTGTSFDIISVSSGTTGTIRVQVYDANSGTQLKSWIVDTYYGFTREENGFVRYEYQKNGDQWDVHGRLVDAKGNDETGLPEIDQATPGVKYVVYEKHYLWTPTTNDSMTLYQVPVISSENALSYGTYRVRITPMYAAMFDPQKNGSYDFYLDGIRIYNPVADDDQVAINEQYYLPDVEGWPKFYELRDYLIEQQLSDSTIQGLVFIDHIDEVADASDYKYYGPNNEIYLAPGQSVSFAVEDASDVSGIQLSAKRITEETPTLGISFDNQMLPDLVVNSSSEMYYKIINKDLWESSDQHVITITNKSNNDAEVSLLKLKITHDSNPSESAPTQLVINTNVMQLSRQMAWSQYTTSKVGKAQHYVLSLHTKPTSTQTGIAVATCAETGSAVQITLPILNSDSYTSQVVKDPTCAAAGEREYSFADPIYGSLTWTESIQAHGHDFEKIEHANYTVYRCRTCHYQKQVTKEEDAITGIWAKLIYQIQKLIRSFFAQFVITKK